MWIVSLPLLKMNTRESYKTCLPLLKMNFRVSYKTCFESCFLCCVIGKNNKFTKKYLCNLWLEKRIHYSKSLRASPTLHQMKMQTKIWCFSPSNLKWVFDNVSLSSNANLHLHYSLLQIFLLVAIRPFLFHILYTVPFVLFLLFISNFLFCIILFLCI